jgi:hypothetical protein
VQGDILARLCCGLYSRRHRGEAFTHTDRQTYFHLFGVGSHPMTFLA